MTIASSLFSSHDLGDQLTFLVGTLPPELFWDDGQFTEVWNLHPDEHPRIHIHGKEVAIPRWQQAYGMDYHFSGKTSTALPVPETLVPLLTWVQNNIFAKLNGLLLNWYEGPGHFIGPHHDSTKHMVADAPIVTISFGETRKFRLSKVDGESRLKQDFLATHGTVFVIPFDTNQVWKHSVPKSTRYKGRRISVTIRAFDA